MTDSNKRTAKLLGTSFGAAGGKLRKEILFHLVKKLNLDICYRCKKKIIDLSTFSIDHKKSWRFADDPVKTFFDLENITFSHFRCNSREGRRPHKIYQDEKERIRESDSRYLTKHREKILARRRKRYHETKKKLIRN